MSNTNIQAYALYNAGTNTPYDVVPQLVSLNCARFGEGSPKEAFLKRRLAYSVSGGSTILYSITFDANDPEIDDNTLNGVTVQQDGLTVFIDAESAEAVLETCNACCDATSYIVPRYYSSGVVPKFVVPTAAQHTITRVDSGTPAAVDKFSLDYLTQTVGDVLHTSWVSNTGVSTYKIYTIGTPTVLSGDTLVS